MYHIVLSLQNPNEMYPFSSKSNLSPSNKSQSHPIQNNHLKEIEKDSIVQFVKSGVEYNETFCEVHYLRRNEPFKLNETIQSNLLCCIAVPSSMSLNDFIEFVQPYLSSISILRFLRMKKSSTYGVLIECKTIEYANSLYHSLNGSMYPIENSYCCHIVFVDTLYYYRESNHSTQKNILKEPVYIIQNHREDSIPSQSTPILLSDLYSDINELPSCAICLERLELEISCLAVTFCSHIFHCNCLYKWSNPHCPVCRTLQGDEQLSQCSVCHCTNNLWICLICGYIGCGRYTKGHAYQHFLNTQHIYTLNIETQRTWDYSQDKYVHRLIRNETDGKIISIPSLEEEITQNQIYDKKEQMISHDYEEMYNTQLESQKAYYEEKLNLLEQRNKQLYDKIKSLEQTNQQYHHQIEQLGKIIQENTSRIHILENNTKNILSSNHKDSNESTSIQENTSISSDTDALVTSLQKRIDTMTAVFQFQIQQKDAQIAELKEENDDLYKHITMQELLPKDCQSSSIILPSNNQIKNSNHENHSNSLTFKKSKNKKKRI